MTVETVAHRYRLWGLTIASEQPLPELEEVADGTPYAAVAFGPADAGATRNLPPGRAFFEGVAAMPSPEGARLVFEQLAAFDIPARPGVLTVRPAPDLPATTMRHLLLDHAIPRALASWGHAMLHASAVELPQGTVAFFGLTGRGKSTLAAAFAAEGVPVVADDGVRIEERDGVLLAHGSYPGLRLFPDSQEATLSSRGGEPVAHYAAKLRVKHGVAHAAAARPLRLAFALGDPLPAHASPRARIERVRRSEAFLLLTESLMSLDDDAAGHRYDFNRLADSPLLDRVRRLRMAPGLDDLTDALAVIRRAAGA